MACLTIPRYWIQGANPRSQSCADRNRSVLAHYHIKACFRLRAHFRAMRAYGTPAISFSAFYHWDALGEILKKQNCFYKFRPCY